ncbi:MAG: ATP-binding protein [Burkholderiales bacterium]
MAAVPIALTANRTKPEKIAHDIVVGKDVLELVTGAMYVEPLTIYREYIQNAADAIDEARAEAPDGLHRVDIAFDHPERAVRIRDTGIGVPNSSFSERLTAIGGSQKRGRNEQRGFRGVGRLAGLGYAQEVVFRSRSSGDSKVYELSWNVRKLRECLRRVDFADDLSALVREVTELTTLPGIGWPSSFFEVELRKLARVRNDVLMNPDEIGAYLAQVAPIPFSPEFRFKEQIEKYLKDHGISTGIEVFVDGAAEPLYRPFRDVFPLNEKARDEVADVELFTMPGISGETDAVGFILHHSYLGSLPKATGIGGLRLRSGNIQVGSHALLEGLFTEPRFNGWCTGEVHVVSSHVIPNGRRDDFEVNAHYQNLHGHLAVLAARLSKQCRERSILRNRLRQVNLIIEGANEHIALICDPETPPIARQFFHKNVEAAIAKLELLSTQARNLSDSQRAHIARSRDSIRNALAQTKRLRRHTNLTFLPVRKAKVFSEFLQMLLQSCDSPQGGAVLVKRMLEKARRTKK